MKYRNDRLNALRKRIAAAHASGDTKLWRSLCWEHDTLALELAKGAAVQLVVLREREAAPLPVAAELPSAHAQNHVRSPLESTARRYSKRAVAKLRARPYANGRIH